MEGPPGGSSSEEVDLDYLEEWDPSRVGFGRHIVAGSFAGLAEHCVMFPLDTVKTHAQCVGKCGSQRRPDVLCISAAKQLVRDKYAGSSGMRLWRGIGAVTAACVPAHAVYFSTFEATRLLGESYTKETGASLTRESVFWNGLGGAVAVVGHDAIMTPADVIKQRLQLGHHAGVMDALRSALSTGGLASLYRSLPTTLAMNVPNGCFSVAANEWLKAKWRARNWNGEPLGIAQLLTCGGIAGALASFATTPLDVVKTRLQTQGLTAAGSSGRPPNQPSTLAPCAAGATATATATGAAGPQRAFASLAAGINRVQYHGFFDAASSIWHQDGPRGFYRGAALRALAQAPSVAIVWTTYETLVNATFLNPPANAAAPKKKTGPGGDPTKET